MKTIFAVIALVAFTGTANAQTSLTQTQEYRMWSAEQMTNRLVTRFGRTLTQCNRMHVKEWLPKHSEECNKAVLGLHPILQQIRETAMSGNEVAWARIIDIVHTYESETEAPLQKLERR